MANKIQWVKMFARGDHPVLLIDSIARAHQKNHHQYFRIPVRMQNYLRCDGVTYYEASELAVMKKTLIARLQDKWPLTIAEKIKNDFDALYRYARSLNARKTAPTKAQLERFFVFTVAAWQGTYFPIVYDWYIEEELKRLISRLSNSDQVAILATAMQPARTPAGLRYRKALEKIGHHPTEAEISTILRRFGWIKSYFMDIKLLTKKDILNDLKTLKPTQKRRAALSKLSTPIHKLIKAGQVYTWLRDYRLFAFGRIFTQMKPVFEKYIPQLSYKEISQLTIQELLQKRFDRGVIQTRQRGYGFVMLNGKIEVLTGAKLDKLRSTLSKKRPKSTSDATEIRGISAMQGMARGVVHIVNPYTFHLIQPGDIVVTAETTPNAVQYLRGVKAIITDEGGITSHAAVISRELHVPCVVGTKNATQILQDGVIVDVDANHGIIKLVPTKKGHNER